MNIQLFSIHGLVRGSHIELGRDADTGGQIRYVVELARALSRRPEVDRVVLFTRKISDSCVNQAYTTEIEKLSSKAQIVRIPCGPSKYLRKELLWPYLDEFANRTIAFCEQSGNRPSVIHGHYVDAGVVSRKVAGHFKVPLVFTAHSLGKPKLKMLLEQGISREEANARYAIDHRIEQEQAVLDNCDLVVTSTQHEAHIQYGAYRIREGLPFEVIAPGTEVAHFFPYNIRERIEPGESSRVSSPHSRSNPRPIVQNRLIKLLGRFLCEPDRPMILSICRPDKRKNLSALVELYGESEELQKIANLVMVAGNRNDVRVLPEKEREVFTDLLMSMDRYDLYGKMALPKRHCSETDVPELLRMAAERGGVFVNPAHFELFGLTSIESAAVGLPFIATNEGGPVDIAQRTQAGIVVDVDNLLQFTAAIKLVLSDHDLWQRMSAAGIDNVRKKYQWDVHANKYFSALRNLVVPTQIRQVSKSPPGGYLQVGQALGGASAVTLNSSNALLSES